MFMNEYEVMEAASRYEFDPVMGPATKTLLNLMEWTNRNSDGWAYWPKPTRAAKNLMVLIQQRQSMDRSYRTDQVGIDAEMVKTACRPIKAFCTRQKVERLIVVPV